MRLSAGIHAIQFGTYFRLLSKRFPWSVYYQLEGDEIRVYAVVDNRRDPGLTRNRMTD